MPWMKSTGGEVSSFDDTAATDGTTYYYSVRAVVGGTEEAAGSPVVQASPVARSCSTGNPIVLENCYPGNRAARDQSLPEFLELTHTKAVTCDK